MDPLGLQRPALDYADPVGTFLVVLANVDGELNVNFAPVDAPQCGQHLPEVRHQSGAGQESFKGECPRQLPVHIPSARQFAVAFGHQGERKRKPFLQEVCEIDASKRLPSQIQHVHPPLAVAPDLFR